MLQQQGWPEGTSASHRSAWHGRQYMRQNCPGITNLSPNQWSATDQGETSSEAIREVTRRTDVMAAETGTAAPADLASASNDIAEEARFDEMLTETLVATGATGAAIALVRGAEMVCCASAGTNAPELGTTLDPGTGLTGCCIQTREIQQCNNTEINPYVNLEACQRLGVRSIIVLPLMDSDQMVGVFEVLSSRPDAFGPHDVSQLQLLANRILESKPPHSKVDATQSDIDPELDPTQPELLARQFFLASAPGNTATHRRKYWMPIQTAAIIALAVVLGWMVGHASWEMAIDRAESQGPLSQKDLQPARRVAQDVRSESAFFSENEGGAFQTQGIRDVDLDAGPGQVSREETDGYVLSRVIPKYPEKARQQHIQGRVIMQVSVGSDGLVREIMAASGDPQLVKAAANAVRHWRFKPRNVEGQAVRFETQITINFTLT